MKLLELPNELLQEIYYKSRIARYKYENYGYENLTYKYEFSALANICKYFHEKKINIIMTPITHNQYKSNYNKT